MARARVEAVSVTPPPLPGPALMRQAWLDLTFVHWRVDPADVAPLLPPGTVPDVHDGSSWLGLVPFRTSGGGLARGPAVPWLGAFAETNVRLYCVDVRGRRGVVFRTMEAARLGFVLGARWTAGLPYAWARMRVVERDGVLTYTSRRRWPRSPAASARVVVRPGAPRPAGDPLDAFLTARWALHSERLGRTLYLRNRHEPWPLQDAELLALDASLVDACALPVGPRPPDSVLFSRGVHAVFGPPSTAPRDR
ncbi:MULTISPECIES: YqjF family protein [unclassified Actinotalea]|uniref:YqjF family protein n=1 Tax=unclassified Actinotalea TaxID=2638618 RepID=UPI0015F3D26A|nr:MULTISPECIES: DUF2071 domain-containing protein [unclassified Actinotalea]